MKSSFRLLMITLTTLVFLPGCTTFRSDIEGSSDLDAVPKLQKRHQILDRFGDILLDADQVLKLEL